MSTARISARSAAGTDNGSSFRTRFVRRRPPAAPVIQARSRPRLAITVLGMLDDHESMHEDALLTQLLDEHERECADAHRDTVVVDDTATDETVEVTTVVATDTEVVRAVADAVVGAPDDLAEGRKVEPSVVIEPEAAVDVVQTEVRPKQRARPASRRARNKDGVGPITAPGWPVPGERPSFLARTPEVAANVAVYTIGLRPALGVCGPMTLTPYRAVHEAHCAPQVEAAA